MSTVGKQRSAILTGFLALLLFYNSAVALQWGSYWIIFQTAEFPDLETEEMKTELGEHGLSIEEAESALSEAETFAALYAISKAASAISLAGLFFWKKVSFWFFCVATIAAFLTDLWGDSTAFELAVDLAPLIILVVLLKFLQPIAWTQFD